VLEILQELAKKHPDAVPARALSEAYQNPVTDGSGRGVRANLAKAKKILEEAGWKLGDDGVLAKDGVPLKFEILSNSDAFERWVQPMIGNLKKLGVVANLRVVDTAQYQNRMDSFDYDITVSTFGQSLSPGNEQRDFWHSEKAAVNGSRNLIGIKNPAIDELIDMIVNAPDRAELVARTQALDRILLWHFYVIPQWHIGAHRVAYWNKFGRPETTAKYGLGIADTWWFDAQKAAQLSTGNTQEKGK
jgi:microcin C transport system substrate-binding protein